MRKEVKKVLIKSIGYRVITMGYEFLLAIALPYLGIKALTSYVAVDNTIKFIGYLLYELIWIGDLRTRLNFVDKILKWVGKNGR